MVLLGTCTNTAISLCQSLVKGMVGQEPTTVMCQELLACGRTEVGKWNFQGV